MSQQQTTLPGDNSCRNTDGNVHICAQKLPARKVLWEMLLLFKELFEY